MNIEDLEEALEEVFPNGYRFATDTDGQLVIYTKLREDDDGDLVSHVDDYEDEDEDEDSDDEEDEDDSDEDSDDEDEEEELTPEQLAEMDFEELESLCEDNDLDTDPDNYDEEDIEKLRKSIAKELGMTLPKGKSKKK